MPEGFDTYRDGSLRADRYVNPVTVRTPGSGDETYADEGTQGQGLEQIMHGAGDIISGSLDVATHPLAVGAIAGYYAGKKKFTGSFRPRGGKGKGGGGGSSTPDDDGWNLPPDDADGPPRRTPPPPPFR
jgi:hypothetical protein